MHLILALLPATWYMAAALYDGQWSDRLHLLLVGAAATVAMALPLLWYSRR